MDPPNNPLENVLFEGVVIPVVIRPFRKKSFAFVKSYLERIVKNLPKAKNCFCMFPPTFLCLVGMGKHPIQCHTHTLEPLLVAVFHRWQPGGVCCNRQAIAEVSYG